MADVPQEPLTEQQVTALERLVFRAQGGDPDYLADVERRAQVAHDAAAGVLRAFGLPADDWTRIVPLKREAWRAAILALDTLDATDPNRRTCDDCQVVHGLARARGVSADVVRVEQGIGAQTHRRESLRPEATYLPPVPHPVEQGLQQEVPSSSMQEHGATVGLGECGRVWVGDLAAHACRQPDGHDRPPGAVTMHVCVCGRRASAAEL